MARTKKFTVIILAGDRGQADPVAAARSVTRKVLVPLLGKPMIDYVIDVVCAAESTGKVMIAANDVVELSAALRHIEDVEWYEGDKTPASTILKIMNHRDLDYPLLVVTADNPLLTADRIDDFCLRSMEDRAKLTVALATRTNIRAAFPNMKRTYVKLKGEAYSGCNLVALKLAATKDVARFWTNVEESRKSPLKIASAFGFWNMLLVFFGRFDLKAAMMRASKVLGIDVAGIIVEDAEAAIDVDRPEHISIVEDILLARSAADNTNISAHAKKGRHREKTATDEKQE
jgi:molybdopterin-guanine dinucleotide biosynthesis protein A